jgi:hypothetical protein
MLISILYKIILLTFIGLCKTADPQEVEIMGIEPHSGPVFGETRVLVRLKELNPDLIDDYPRPKVMFIFN